VENRDGQWEEGNYERIAVLCFVIHFAELSKEEGFFAVKWPYVLAFGFCSCVTHTE